VSLRAFRRRQLEPATQSGQLWKRLQEMTDPSLSEFVSNLEKSQLLTVAQMQLLRKQLVGNKLTTEGLANTLVGQKHLTVWQAKQLLKGQTGFLLDHYRLLDPIGRGGMGHVFRGLNSRTKDVVAVKVMAKKLAGNQALVSRFRREIRANAKLNSRHIVKSLDAGRVGKTDFMVMEYVNGDQVDRIANRLGRLPVGLACEIVRQVAVGLQHAHEHQMVHRDIKPGNMMVHWTEFDEGIVKLMDMGLVLLMADDADEKTVTRAGQVMGTPDYMSPEQGWDTTHVDIRSDVYSLGCTLFRLLSGSVPFIGSNPLQVLSQRLQRDAPSVRTVCDDIPQDVAAVVSKMTARNPDARYQIPSEVAAVLAEFSEPLTKSALKVAARKGNSQIPVDVDDFNPNEIDETDGTYQQFLREVQDGSVVDLMLATDPGDSPAVATVPLLEIDHSSPSLRGRDYVTSSRRGQKTSFVVMGITAIVIAVLAVVASSNRNDQAVVQPVAKQSVAEDLPIVSIKPSELGDATTGQLWTHHVVSEVSEGGKSVHYELGNSAPVAMQIDGATGRLSWQVPDEQTLTTYTVRVMVVYDIGGEKKTLTESVMSLNVVKGFGSIRFPGIESMDVPPGEALNLSVAVNLLDAELFDLRYDLDDRFPPGMTIDRKSGMISWTPTVLEIGRHTVNVSVQDAKSPDLKKSASLNFLVIPTQIDHVLPPLPAQKAVAGKMFRFVLPPSRLTRGPRGSGSRVISPGPNAPAGVVIDPVSSELTWDVPADVSGIVKIPLVAKLDAVQARRDRKLEGVAFLEVDVASSPAQPLSSMPPENQIAAALEQLKETFGKSIAQARTTTEKAALASRLLEQCIDSSPSAADAALLQLIELDIAAKARATDVLLDIGRIRAAKYGVDELKAAAKVIDGFRKTGLNQRQQDQVVEHCLRLSKVSAAKKQFQFTTDLLHTVSTLLGRSVQGTASQFPADVAAAEKIAAELAQVSDSLIDDLKVNELTRLIDRWQFQKLFAQSSSFAFVQLSPGEQITLLDGNGRDLWIVDSSRVRLESETQPTLLAIVDRSIPAERYVFRFEVENGSNSVQLLFGVTGTTTDNFDAYRLTLDASGPGQIQALKSSGLLNDPTKTTQPVVYSDQSNLVELLVDGPAVVVRINGVMVSRANIPDLPAGPLGIATDLRGPKPRLSIRNPRILVIPGTE